jgi:hypothetical protein
MSIRLSARELPMTVAIPGGKPPPLLSVIVPVYNEEATVDQLLQRLVEGPYSDPAVFRRLAQ